MRIPDGDLVPARRRSRYGGHGHRRRRARVLRVGLVLLLVAAGVAVWLSR